MQRYRLGLDYNISRVIRGGWQMAGGHGAIRAQEAILDMMAFADAGITTFDCADIYTGVEDLIGAFRLRYGDAHGAEALARIKVHTKFVPDLDILPRITKSDVARVIDRSLSRLGMERLDLVQFHWWDYEIPRWLETAQWLDELRLAGKIRHLGGTNSDTEHMRAMVANGVPLVSMQVQYSLLDRRPECAMIAAAAALVKYKLIIDEFGGWDLCQALLSALRGVADRHDTDIATIASAAMLARPGVGAVIVGARNRAHLLANLKIAEIALTSADLAAIDAVLAAAQPIEGDVYAVERDRSGRHGAIMKYNLSSVA
jgi:aryl-alcohol dehydrogenase-like predicted oxidoreductase